MSQQRLEEIGPASTAASIATQPEVKVARVDFMTGERVEDLPPPATAQKLVGLGGWLILPAIWTWLAPLMYLYSTAAWVWHISHSNFSQLPISLKAYILFSLAVSAILICGSGYALIAMLRKMRIYPRLFIGLCVAVLALEFIFLSIDAFLFNVPVLPSQSTDLARSLVMCAIWIPYMLMSHRVKNTFTN